MKRQELSIFEQLLSVSPRSSLPEVGCQIHDPLAIEQWQRDEPARPAPCVLKRETDATPSGLRQLQHGSGPAAGFPLPLRDRRILLIREVLPVVVVECAAR